MRLDLTERLSPWLDALGSGLRGLLGDEADGAPGDGSEGAGPAAELLSPALWALARRSWSCSACQACNAVCPLIATARLSRFTGPQDLVRRLVPQLPVLRPWEEHLRTYRRCGSCRACEQACPEQIPLLQLARELGQVLDALNARNPAQGPKDRSAGTHDPG